MSPLYINLCACQSVILILMIVFFFFFQAEDGIRDAQESRGLGDVYKRQPNPPVPFPTWSMWFPVNPCPIRSTQPTFMEVLAKQCSTKSSRRTSTGIAVHCTKKHKQRNTFETRNNYCVTLNAVHMPCLLYTSDAADEEDSVDLGGRRIIKKKK
eukprot:TRINITY_DN6105_c0_g1_i2.p1 TRINITY_DN6105_c0_g1~~TRINITY_DN6105_c0_g1_i2.p1  ORF type:complete len:154 (-),score=24.59 TRINITY_DN6105_c0_g1_i2:54-515(-)